MADIPSRRRSVRKPRVKAVHVLGALENLTLTALDPAKFTLLVVKVPLGISQEEFGTARVACDILKAQHAIGAYLIVPEDYKVAAIERTPTPQQTAEMVEMAGAEVAP